MRVVMKKIPGVEIIILDKIDLKEKGCNKRQRRNTIIINEYNPTREYNPCKHLSTQHRTD